MGMAGGHRGHFQRTVLPQGPPGVVPEALAGAPLSDTPASSFTCGWELRALPDDLSGLL